MELNAKNPTEAAVTLVTLAKNVDQRRAAALAPATAAVTARIAALTNSKKPVPAHVQAVSAALARTAAASKNVPAVSPETYVIQASITNERNAPRADCSLVATDPGDALSSKVRPQLANADGYATIVLRKGEFPTIVDGTVPVFVSVIDGAGREVFAPATPLQAKSGTAAVFRVVVPGQATTPGSPPGK